MKTTVKILNVTLLQCIICLVNIKLIKCLNVPLSSEYNGYVDSTNLPTDRLLEISWRFFDHPNVTNKNGYTLSDEINLLYNKVEPLFSYINGNKYLICICSWLLDIITEWTGNPLQPFPINNTDAPQWSYLNATYKDVKIFFDLLHTNGKNYNLKIGLGIIGWSHIYNIKTSIFSQRHPELYIPNTITGSGIAVAYDTYMMKDKYPYATYPNGVSTNTSFLEFFGNQWSNLSQYLNLNALVLRDGLSTFPGFNKRIGPFGFNASMNFEENYLWMNKNKKLFREMKKGCLYMNCDIIGYSSAASAISEYMVGLIDVEELVSDGYIDIWVDESWSGAFEDVPNRLKTKGLGWTMQLNYIMAHRAQIVRGNRKRTNICKHYVLHDTFDSYEGWDTIHNIPNKLAWGIWIYHHVAYLDVNPYSYIIADGSYISWANSWNYVKYENNYLSNPLGLLTTSDIEFITSHLNAAEFSAININKIYSPILLYNRNSFELIMNSTVDPTYNFNQWFDMQLGMINKFGFPCLLIGDINHLNNYYLNDIKYLNLFGFIFHGG
eukprot:17490_1